MIPKIPKIVSRWINWITIRYAWIFQACQFYYEKVRVWSDLIDLHLPLGLRGSKWFSRNLFKHSENFYDKIFQEKNLPFWLFEPLLQTQSVCIEFFLIYVNIFTCNQYESFCMNLWSVKFPIFDKAVNYGSVSHLVRLVYLRPVLITHFWAQT